jgi:hypothetical protein
MLSSFVCMNLLYTLNYSWDHFGNISLTSVEGNKKVTDELKYF